MLSDVRFALRMLFKAPGFLAVAVLTLALGIGANTAIFSLIDGIFLRGLPYPHADELVRFYGAAPERNLSQLASSATKFEHIRDHQSAFSAVASMFFSGFTLSSSGDPEQLNGLQVTSNFFDVLGVTPIQGRLFRPDEEVGEHVALVGEGFWINRLNRDPAIIGRVLTLNGVPHTVIGVLPELPRAMFGQPDVWTTRPEEWPGMTPELRARGFSFLQVIARIKPGVSLAQAREDADAVIASYKRNNGARADSTWKAQLIPLEEDVLGGQLRSTLWMLFGAVGFVLLIATSNVANLLLVRFSARRREIALRSALGAARQRVVRLFLIESLLLSGMAAAVGAALAQFGLRILLSLNAPLPVDQNLTLNGLVLAFAVGISLVAGIAMGLYPSFQAARTDVVEALKEGGRSNTLSQGQHRFRMTLLAGQVALSFVLLVGALLLVSSFMKLQRQDPGFNPDHVMVANVNLPSTRYPDKVAMALVTDRLIETMRHAPGVAHAAVVAGAPLTGFGIQGPYSRNDDKVIPYPQRPLGLMRFTGPGFFKTLGVRIAEGRDFTEADRAESSGVIILSQTAARQIYPEGGALGKHMLIGSLQQGVDSEIVGIAADIRSVALAQPPVLEIYRPLAQRPGNSGQLQILVSTISGDPLQALPALRNELKALDPALPLIRPIAMPALIGGSISGERFLMTLLGVFAGLAMALAVVGIYSIVAFLVGQRTPEIGVRLALGAEPRDIVRLVLRQGMTPVVAGLVIGIGGALLVGRSIQDLLFGTTRFDLTSFVVTSVALALAGLLACWLPSRRAARVAPSSALR